MSTQSLNASDEAVRNATGRTWKEWERFLDAVDAAERSHKEIVTLLRTEGGVESGWWQQMVANGYEKLKGRRKTGQTLGTGYQIGVQRTVPVSPDEAWRVLTSTAGMEAWLGPGADIVFEKGTRYRLPDGAQGEVRVVNPPENLRVTYRPKQWKRHSTIQVRVNPKDERCTITFHEEGLPDQDEREKRRTHFKQAFDRIKQIME